MNNQKGVTLIELLATLVIFGIFSTIIWAFMMQTFRTNEVEISKNQLQQEATLIINAIDEVHRNSISYSIKFDSNEIIIIPQNSDKISFSNPNIIYDITPLLSRETVTPKTQNLTFNLVLISKANESIKTSIKTTFKRLK